MQAVGIGTLLAPLLPAIRARRAEIEQSRRVPRDLIDQLCRTGIFGLGVPRALGGREATPAEIMHVIETLSAADGSVGWCTMVGIANNTSAGYMNEVGAREVFANPEVPSAGLAAPAGSAVREDGGVRISGRWSFASGIAHCEWVWAGCIVMEGGQPRMTPHGPEIVHVCMPVADIETHDTWRVSGLCGTGSDDISAADVFVPDRRIFALLDPSGHRPEPLFQMPPVAWFSSQLACVSIGIARGALDELVQLAPTKVPSLYTQPLADKPIAQVEIARAEAAWQSARAFLYGIVERMWESLSAGRPPTLRDVALARLACSNAVETGAAVAATVNRLAGGSSIYLTSSLQRHARDAEAMTHHFTVAPYTWEEAGRVLLGRQPSTPVF